MARIFFATEFPQCWSAGKEGANAGRFLSVQCFGENMKTTDDCILLRIARMPENNACAES